MQEKLQKKRFLDRYAVIRVSPLCYFKPWNLETFRTARRAIYRAPPDLQHHRCDLPSTGLCPIYSPPTYLSCVYVEDVRFVRCILQDGSEVLAIGIGDEDLSELRAVD